VPGEGCVFQFDIPLVPIGAGDMADCHSSASESAIGLMAHRPEDHPQNTPARDAALVRTAQSSAAFDLTNVPSGWIKQVQRAAAEADALLLSRLAAEVKGEQPALAVTLQRWIDEYNYGAIQAAIKIS
jgi:hypothetical protein